MPYTPKYEHVMKNKFNEVQTIQDDNHVHCSVYIIKENGEKEYLKDFSTVNHLFKAPKGNSTEEREKYLMDGGQL